jgi:hypothetical protein
VTVVIAQIMMSSQNLNDIVASVLNSNPPWLSYSLSELHASLCTLSRDELHTVASHISPVFWSGKHYDKLSCINLILEDFNSQSAFLSSCSTSDICAYVHQSNLSVSTTLPRYRLISAIFNTVYGPLVASTLRNSPWPVLKSISISKQLVAKDMPWVTEDLSLWMARIPRKLTIGRLKACLQSMLPSTRPLFKSSSKQSCWHVILHHLKQRARFLFSQEDIYVINQLLSSSPLVHVNEDSHMSFVRDILNAEYGEDILSEISCPFLTRKQSVNACVKVNKLNKKMKEHMTTFKIVTEIKTSWPQKVSREIVFKRLNEYFEGTMWTLPPPCAVCSQQIHDSEVTSIIIDSNASTLPHHLNVLSITDPFIIRNCIIRCNSAEFVFGYQALDGLMLYKSAIRPATEGNVILDICTLCYSSLRRATMPKFALANSLYRGELPYQFHDLTWVEEMVCSHYRYTAHITRLFQSSDPMLPNVLHGNTCAHEMNVVSTASVLPCTPADINETLSVVFIGPGKLRPEFLKNIYHIRKQKVWDFLLWLTSHNILYSHMLLD